MPGKAMFSFEQRSILSTTDNLFTIPLTTSSAEYFKCA